MKYVVFLGNPGKKYKKTVHNVAWMIADEMAPSLWSFNKYMNANIYKDYNFTFIKPQTFMNKSGESLAYLIKKESLKAEDVVVIYDDLDLYLGDLKLSKNRGSGGHNGVKSIIQHLGSKDFVRIRVGVSQKRGNGNIQKPNVLANFSILERRCVEDHLADDVHKILEALVSLGFEKTMNIYNTKKSKK